jgi:hypothetical protein
VKMERSVREEMELSVREEMERSVREESLIDDTTLTANFMFE